MKYYIGIDLGGTNIVAGVVDEEYNIVAKASTKTNCPRPAKEIADDMARMALQATKNANLTIDQIEWVGIGTPGIANSETGIVERASNLGLKNTPMVKYIQETINKPVFIENDANAAAYGEYVAGAAKGAKNAVCITLGTGVGGGIIRGGKIVAGTNGAAGEIGHIPMIDDESECCGCGKKGCLEQYASANGLVNVAEKYIAAHRTVETELDLNAGFTAKDVCDAAKAGDIAGLAAVEESMRLLGKAMASVSCVIDPQVFVVGGGLSKAGNIIIDTASKYYKEYAFHASRETEIKLATLGNAAGMYGGVKMVIG